MVSTRARGHTKEENKKTKNKYPPN